MEVDERERPKNEIEKQVLLTGEKSIQVVGDRMTAVAPYKARAKGCSETSGYHVHAKESARNVVSVANSTEDTRSVALEGTSIISKTMDSMNLIAEASSMSAEKIKSLTEHTNNIHHLMELLKGITNQTKLLALNASI